MEEEIMISFQDSIAEGNTAVIYPFGDKVIKVFHSLPESEALYEAKKQEFAYDMGLPVPKVYDVLTVDKKSAIVMEYIQGRTLGSILLEDRSHAEDYLQISVDLQMQVHTITTNPYQKMTDKLMRQIRTAKLLEERQKEVLLQKMNQITYDARLCHGDFHVLNILIKENRPFIIDWADSSLGDPCADVCRSYLIYTQFSQELAKLYVDLYCKKSHCSKDEILVWESILAGAKLSENLSSQKAKHLFEKVCKYCK